MNTTTSTSPSSSRALWISAIILGAIAVLQLGLPLFASRPALAAPAAADVASIGDHTILTLATSTEDLLLVLDGRNESILVYHVRNKNSLEALTGGDLRALFANGRRIGSGVK